MYRQLTVEMVYSTFRTMGTEKVCEYLFQFKKTALRLQLRKTGQMVRDKGDIPVLRNLPNESPYERPYLKPTNYTNETRKLKGSCLKNSSRLSRLE